MPKANHKRKVKAVIEQVLEEEMTEHLGAAYRERTDDRRGERNGHYSRSLITPVAKSNSFASLGTEIGLLSRRFSNATRG